jgi:hypothetical protein
METGCVPYGVTMQKPGVSKITRPLEGEESPAPTHRKSAAAATAA